ncbi:MAG: thioredoxin family protein [Candidatus Caenarcaniphilales bacterium]|nr:thioredoxin family protein [Candidatus Caenarcaniphilales bacterium]
MKKNFLLFSLIFVTLFSLSSCSSISSKGSGSKSQLVTFLEANSSENFAVIKFFATWCGTCKRYAPEFARVEADYAKRKEAVDFYSVDVDNKNYAALVRELKIGVIPTTYFISKDRKTVYNRIGNIKTDKLDALIQDLLAK